MLDYNEKFILQFATLPNFGSVEKYNFLYSDKGREPSQGPLQLLVDARRDAARSTSPWHDTRSQSIRLFFK